LYLFLRSEAILQSRKISVAPPQRPHKGSVSYLPFAAPRSKFYRERLVNEDEEEEEEEEDEDEYVDEDEEIEGGNTTKETADSDPAGMVEGEKNVEDILAGISEREETSNDEKGDDSIVDDLGLEKMNVEKGDDSGLVAGADMNKDKEGTGVIASGDATMASPPPASPPPEGSSRVTGGVLRGRAVGNVLSFTDAQDLLTTNFVPAKGTVRLYPDLSHNPSYNKPIITLKTEAKPTLGPVLKRLARGYSPIRNNNYRIYVHEEGSWSIKGRYNDAVEDDEEITWVPGNGQLTLSICAEGKDIFASASVPSSHVPAIGTSGAPESKAVIQGEISKKELVALLNIPEQLAQPMKNPGLRLNYAKYKACIMAQDTLRQKIKDNTWPEGVKKPTSTNIIELFVSRSFWHHYMTQAFHDIAHYPLLKDWLENIEGGPTDEEVWGTIQSSYGFSDLQKEKERRQQQAKGKGKVTKKDSSAEAKKQNKKKVDK
jgi:hypothetical protein